MTKDQSQPSLPPTVQTRPRRSQVDRPSGTLYIVGTPIGDPDDLSLRAAKILSKVSLIAAENPAVTSHLLAHHGISSMITSYGPTGLNQKVAILIYRLLKGQDLALVVDGGMPTIHDPGQLLVTRSHEAKIPVVTVPGPSIATAAFACSGFSADCFVFAGAIPRSHVSCRRFLLAYRAESKPVLFLAARQGLLSTLRVLENLFGPRQLTLIADLTKPGEVIWRGTAKSILPRVKKLPRAAEITLVLGGKSTRRAEAPPRSAGRTTHSRGGE